MIKNIQGALTPHPSSLTLQHPRVLPVNAKLVNARVPLTPHPSSLTLKVTRLFTKGEYTHGHLTIDGTRICDTLENSNGLVPAGDYPLHLIKCKQYSRKMPVLNPEAPCSLCKKSLNSVLPCWCPMIKPGNGVHDRLDGSIIVGRYNCLGSIIHPKSAFDALYERIRKSLSRGNEVILTIMDIPSSLHSHPSSKYIV